jgi:ribosomal protein L37AE/L43A
MKNTCIECGELFAVARALLGHRVCLTCGDAAAKAARKRWTVAPMHKSNYVLVTNRDELIGMNNKGGQVRT